MGALAAAFGQEEEPQEDSGDGGLVGKAKRAGSGLLQGAVEVLGAPQQAIARTVQQVGEGDVGGILGSAANLATLGVSEIGKQDISVTEALQPFGVEKLPFGLETGLSIATDPLTYLTFGASGAAKGATKQLAQAGADDIVKAVAQQGGRKALQGEMKDQALSSLTRLGQGRGLTDEAAQKFADKSVRKIAKSDKGGIAVGLPGGSRKTLRTAQEIQEGQLGNLARLGKKGAEKAGLAPPVRRGIQWAERSLKSGASVVQDLRKAGVDSKDAKNFVRALLDQGSDKVARIMSGIQSATAEVESALKAAGKITKEQEAVLGRALAGEADAIAKVSDEGLETVFTKLKDIEDRTTQLLPEQVVAEAGAGDPEVFQRIIQSLEAQRLPVPESIRKRLADATQEAAAPATKAAKESKGAVTDVLERHYDALQKMEEARYAEALAAAPSPTGVPVLAKNADEIGEEAVSVRLGNQTFFTSPAVKDEITRVGQVLSSDEAIKDFQKAMNGWGRFWKAQLTSFPISAAFTTRNARSNLFLNYLDGVHNPKWYAKAGKMQRRLGQLFRDADLAERSFDDVLAESKKFTPQEKQLIQEARNRGIINQGFVDVEISSMGQGGVERLRGIKETGGQRARRQVSPTKGALGQAGQTMNSAVENNARLANFLFNMERFGGDAAEAAIHTKKFLFDYGELAPFEQRVLRNAVPFYTFMRKNTPLQLQTLVENPAKQVIRLRLGLAAGEQAPEDAPDFLEEAGARILPPGIAAALGQAGEDVALTPDTPFAASIDTIAPLLQLLGSVPGAREAIPEQFQGATGQDISSSLVGMLGGGPGTALKSLAETAGGRSLFTSRGFPQDSNAAMRFISDAFVPGLRRGGIDITQGAEDPLQQVGLPGLLGVGEQRGAEETRRQAALRELLGIRTRVVE